MASVPATGPIHPWNGGLRCGHLALISAGFLTTNSLPLDARLNPARTACCHFEGSILWLTQELHAARTHAPQRHPVFDLLSPWWAAATLRANRGKPAANVDAS
jgi:hypothetical protein